LANSNSSGKTIDKNSYGYRLKTDWRKYHQVYLIFVPVLVYYILFHYAPMYGAIIAFKDFSVGKGILGSPWVGFQHFTNFFNGVFFKRVLTNTLQISFSMLFLGFPAPIILALLINEIRTKRFAKTVQTVTYMPHFISMVVLCGMLHQFTKDTGFITQFLMIFGFPQQTMLGNANLFLPVYVISGIWQEVGWGSIIYLAALSGIDQGLYEAAKIDGAGRWKQTWHITLPGLMPTIVTLLIMRCGRVMNIGAEKVLLLYSPSIYSKADVISTYVYRQGILNADWSAASAVGLFNSVVNFTLLVLVNKLSKMMTESSLW